jgi:hypothetical protein
MKALIAVTLGALGLATHEAVADHVPAPGASPTSAPVRSISRSKPGIHSSKASSFAPRHSRRHVYGAPIQQPIVSRHPAKPAKR